MRKVLLTLMVACGFMLGATAQKTISGKVTDDSGKPIPKVSIIVKGTQAGTFTADDGTYTLTVPANGKTIVFSSLGYEDFTTGVNSNDFSPKLKVAGATQGIEVVVTGITRSNKSSYTGAATKISDKVMKDKPVGSFDQLFQGRVPGVTQLSSSGQPGNASTVIIRGQGTILGGSDPLYVLDGIPIEAAVFQGLNPNDFASVDILRDAAATALYGSRGSAGVIVITTKKGSTGKMKFSYGGQWGTKSKPEFEFRPMNTAELLKAQEDYGRIVGANATTDPNIPGWWYSTEHPRYATLSDPEKAANALIYDSLKKINTNWMDEIFRDGTFKAHNITLSGGTGNTRIYSSLGFYTEEGVTLRTKMDRITLRNNIDYVADKLSYSISTNIGYTKRSFQQSSVTNNLGNPFLVAAVSVPYHVARNSDGSYATGQGTKYAATNTLDITELDRNANNQLKATVGMTASYKIDENFSAGVTGGVDFRETQASNYGSKLAYIRVSSSSITGHAGFQSESLTRFFSGTIRPTAGWRKVFDGKHDVDVNAYGEFVKQYTKGINFTGYGTDPKRPNTPSAITQGNGANQLYAVVGGGKSENSLFGGLFTAKYTYLGKYTVTGSFRNDKSSKLPEDTRSQSFFSIGGIWDSKKEDFMQDADFLNVLRVKLSYGNSGNSDNFPNGDYGYQPLWDQGGYSGLTTQFVSYPGNPEMKWEVTYTLNLGIDFEMLNRRLYGDLNFYDKRTKDVFVDKQLAAEGGFPSIAVNAGEISNKGFEWNVNGDVIKKKDLLITLFANGGYNKNNVESLGGLQSFEQGTELVTVGMPLGSHYEVKWAGVDAATGAPLYYTKDGKITNVYSADDAIQTFGTWEAPWRGGFGANVFFKNFEFSMLFSWQSGGYKSDNMEYFMENPVGFLSGGYNQSSDMRMWQKPGDIASTPSPLYATQFSSKIIHDASFMRLRDAKIAYNLPKDLLDKTKILSNANVYIQGNNLFMWTKWRGMDPEAGATNINLSEFPNPTTFTAGLNVTF